MVFGYFRYEFCCFNNQRREFVLKRSKINQALKELEAMSKKSEVIKASPAGASVMRFSLVKFQVHSRDKSVIRLPRKQVLDEMADKQKQDPEEAFFHLLRVLYFCVLYHIGSQKVVI